MLHFCHLTLQLHLANGFAMMGIFVETIYALNAIQTHVQQEPISQANPIAYPLAHLLLFVFFVQKQKTVMQFCDKISQNSDIASMTALVKASRLIRTRIHSLNGKHHALNVLPTFDAPQDSKQHVDPTHAPRVRL